MGNYKNSSEDLGIMRFLPNTGHHYKFIPIEGLDLREVDIYRSWNTIPRNDKRKFTYRYRFLEKQFKGGESQKGILFSVDSNVGSVNRGSFYKEDPIVPAKEIGKDIKDLESKNIYPFERESSISDERVESLKIEIGGIEYGKLRIECIISRAPSDIAIDLVVDLGNSRSVAMLIEYPPEQNGSPDLRDKMIPLDLSCLNSEYSYSGRKVDESIVDSWFALKEPEFLDLELEEASLNKCPITEVVEKKAFFSTKKMEYLTGYKYIVPHIFSENSPVIIGKTAAKYLQEITAVPKGLNLMSSPKRYAWDKDSSTTHWEMLKNKWKSNEEEKYIPLKGNVLRFLPNNSSHWDITEPPNENKNPTKRPPAIRHSPDNSRADMLVLYILKILETAYFQMNARVVGGESGTYLDRRRSLKNIHVTFPSGWTTPELEAYRIQWEKAINIFAHANIADLNDVPKLRMDIDEAVAAQLPIIYNEISDMHGDGDNWLNLIGNGDNSRTARIMSIDIGGGTTDCAIVEYIDEKEGRGVKLSTNLIFKNSSNEAGDVILKDIIESILLPRIKKDKAKGYEELFDDFWKRGFKENARLKNLIKTCTQMLLAPIAKYWLSRISLGNKAKRPDLPEDISRGVFKAWKAFVENAGYDSDGLVDIISAETLDEFDKTDLEKCIRRSLESTIEELSKYATAYNVDMAFISGKPSEIPCVRDLIVEMLPISRNRILTTKDMPIGDWYPFSTSGKISDAKTINVVGLGLTALIAKRCPSNWSLKNASTIEINDRLPIKWGILNSTNLSSSEFITFDEEGISESIEIIGRARIGRTLYSIDSLSPVYEISTDENFHEDSFYVVFEKEFLANGYSDSIKIKSIEDLDGKPIDPKKITFKLSMVDSDSGNFWMDEGSFTVRKFNK